MGQFRCAAKKFFLTFPQCHVTEILEVSILLFEHLREKGAPKVVKDLIAKEKHEDGGIHYHVILEFAKKLNVTTEDYFDMMGPGGCKIHPNVQAVKNLQKTLEYVVKDGEYINNGFCLDPSRYLTDLIDSCAKDGTTRQQVIKEVMKKGGDKALKWFNQIDAYLQVVMKPAATFDAVKVYPDDFTVTADIDFYIRGFKMMINDDTFKGQRTPDNKSLWLWGPSRVGKTILARSMGKHWYMQSMWNAECLDDNAQYGIMDDIPWENLRINYKGMLGMQKDVTVTDKYRKKTVYKGGLPVIVITNDVPDFTRQESEWIGANVIMVHCNMQLWTPDVVPPTPMTPLINSLF